MPSDYFNLGFQTAQKRLSRLYEDDMVLKKKRGPVTRFFDTLQVGQYASIGAIKGAMSKDLTIAQGISSGIRAANPVGGGVPEGRHSFTDVLDDLGWQPESLGGKFARGVVGFAGDVFLDPLTYVPGGVFLKSLAGTSKMATKVSKIAPMTDDVAKRVVENFYKNHEAAVDATKIAEETARFTERYNRLMGFGERTNPDLYMSLGNAPFGKKIFGSLADARLNLVKAETMLKLGDSITQGAYTKVREKILSSEVLDLFSNNAKLYKLAKSKPEEFYASMRKAQRDAGRTKTSREFAERVSANLAKLQNLTPDEQRQVMEILDNNAAQFVKVEKTFKHLDKEFEIEMKKIVEQRVVDTQRALDNLAQAKKDLSVVFDRDKSAVERFSADIEDINKSMNDMLYELNTEYIKKSDSIYNTIDLLNTQRDEIASKIETEELLRKSTKPGEKFKPPSYDELKGFARTLRDEQAKLKETVDYRKKQFKELRSAKAINQIIYADEYKAINDYYNEANSNAVREFALKVFGNDEYILPNTDYFNMNKLLNIIDPDFDKFLQSNNFNKLKSAYKTNFTNFISDLKKSGSSQIPLEDLYLYQNERLIYLQDFDYTTFIKTIDGKEVKYAQVKYNPSKAARSLIENDPASFNGTRAKMWEHINRIVLGDVHRASKKWEDIYERPIRELYKINDPLYAKTLDPKELTNQQVALLELEALAFKRNYLLEKLSKAKTIDELNVLLEVEEKLVLDFAKRTQGKKLRELLRDGTLNKKTIDEIRSGWKTDFRDIVLEDFAGFKQGQFGMYDSYVPTSKTRTWVTEDAKLRKRLQNLEKNPNIYGEVISNTEFANKVRLYEKHKLDKYSPDKPMHPGSKYIAETDYLIKLSEEKALIEKRLGELANSPYNPDKIQPIAKSKKATTKQSKIKPAWVNTHKYGPNIKYNLLHDETFNRFVAKGMKKDNPAQNAAWIKMHEGNVYRRMLEINKTSIKLPKGTTAFGNVGKAVNMPLEKLSETTLENLRQFAVQDYIFENTYVKGDKYKGDWAAFANDFYKGNTDLSVKQYQHIVDYHLYNPSEAQAKVMERLRNIQARTAKRELHVQQVHDTVGVGSFVDVHNLDVLDNTYKKYEARVVDFIVESDGKILYEVDGKNIHEWVYADKIGKHTAAPKVVSASMVDSGLDKALRQNYEDVLVQISYMEKKLGKLSEGYSAAQVALKKEVKASLKKTRAARTRALNSQFRIEEAYKSMDMDSIPKLLNDLKEATDALDDIDKFHTYIKSHLVDEKTYLSYLKTSKRNAGKVFLDVNDNYSDKVKEAAKLIKSDFEEIGLKEVQMGKLDRRAYEAMKDVYLPHMLTEEGAKFFEAKPTDKYKKVASFGPRYGYGRIFNPHSIARTITRLPDGQGGWINNPNVMDINKFFQDNFSDMLKDKNVFSENLLEIYVARMIKHNELAYDNSYMNDMMDMFGKAVNGVDDVIEKGNKIVSNYGQLKQYVNTNAKIARSMQASDMVSHFMQLPSTQQKIEDNVIKELGRAYRKETGKSFANQGIYEDIVTKAGRYLGPTEARHWEGVAYQIREKYTSKLIKEYLSSEEVTAKLQSTYESFIESYLSKTGMEKMLDDLAVPMAEITPEQIRAMAESGKSTQSKFYHEYIKANAEKALREYYVEYAPIEFAESGLMSSVRTANKDALSDLDRIFNINHGLPAEKTTYEAVYKHVSDALQHPDLSDTMKRKLTSLEKKLMHTLTIDNVPAHQMNEYFVNQANNARKVQILKDQHKFLDLYDKWLHLIKLNQTTVLPSFHSRNKLSNTFNNYLVVGTDVLDINLQINAHKVLWHKGALGGVAEGTNYTWKQLYDIAKDYEVLDEGFFTKDLRAGLHSDGVIGKVAKKVGINIPNKFDPTNTKSFIGYEKGAAAGSYIENTDRFAHFVARIKQGWSLEDAAESVTKTLFDYSDLTVFEKNVMKRIIPYYTWIKNNAFLQLEMMATNAKRYSGTAKTIGTIEGMTARDERMDRRFLEDYAHDWIETPIHYYNERGQKIRILFNPNLPYQDLDRIPNITDRKEFMRDSMAITSPLIKLPIEMAINKNTFFDSPIVRPSASAGQRAVGYSKHALSSLGWYNVGRGIAKKDDVALGLHINNTLTGLKFSPYNYSAFKQKKIQEIARKRTNIQSDIRR